MALGGFQQYGRLRSGHPSSDIRLFVPLFVESLTAPFLLWSQHKILTHTPPNSGAERQLGPGPGLDELVLGAPRGSPNDHLFRGFAAL